MLTKCKENYIPHKEQAIDEAMIGSKGRLGFKQYLPAKPTKFGIKVRERANSCNGYVGEFQVYTGRGGVDHSKVWWREWLHILQGHWTVITIKYAPNQWGDHECANCGHMWCSFLAGVFHELVEIQQLTDIWVVFGMGKN